MKDELSFPTTVHKEITILYHKMDNLLNKLNIIIIIILMMILIYFLYKIFKDGNSKKYWYLVLVFIMILLYYGLTLYYYCFPKEKKKEVVQKKKEKIEKEKPTIIINNKPKHEISDDCQMKSLVFVEESGDKISKKDDKKIKKKSFYKTLEIKINNPEFIRKYTNSLRDSLYKKKVFYEEKLEILLNDISKTDDPRDLFDRKIDAKKFPLYLKKEIEDIICSIDESLEELNESIVQANLKDILYNKERGFVILKEREDVKDLIAEKILSFSENEETFSNHFQNIILYGNPGIGKTTCAKVIGYAYLKSGLLIRDRMKETTKTDFNSSYVEDSSLQTKRLFYENLEGIVFLDEAYEITPKNISHGIAHGTQTIAELCDLLDKWKGKLVFIAGGYQNEMHRFLDVNKGMDRRFPNKLFLENYSAKSLTQIFCSNIPLEISININLVYTFILYGSQNNAFPNQAGDICNLAGEFVSLCYADRETNSEDTLKSIFKNYYIKKLGKTIRL